MEEAPASPAVGKIIKQIREHHYAIACVPSRVYSSGFSGLNVFYTIELKRLRAGQQQGGLKVGNDPSVKNY